MDHTPTSIGHWNNVLLVKGIELNKDISCFWSFRRSFMSWVVLSILKWTPLVGREDLSAPNTWENILSAPNTWENIRKELVKMYQVGKLSNKNENKKSTNNIAPAGNRTRVCTVAGYYSTTRPLVLLCFSLCDFFYYSRSIETLSNHSRRKNIYVADALTDSKWIKDIDYDLTQLLIE